MKFVLQRDSVCYVRSTNVLCFFRSEPGEDEETPPVLRAATEREEQLDISRNA